MKHDIKFEHDGSLVTITASGEPTYAGFETYINELIDSPAWYPGTTVLCDFRELMIKNLSGNEIRSIVNVHKPYMNRIGNSKVAVVVSRRVDFGLVRMWEILAEDIFPQHRGFYTIEEALKWINEEGISTLY